jgi:dTDP-4-amino-4,6-dideoxygalactose transaminase
MPLLTYYRARYGYRPGDFPATDAVFARSLTIPLYEGMSAPEQREVVGMIRRCLE